MTILTAFATFPTEGIIVGRLLASYATLEIDLLNCASMARGDFDATLKAMFRNWGETGRINVGDALARQLYAKQGLETEFGMAIGAMRECLKIRNQYAHGSWYDDHSGQLAFVDLDELAKMNSLVTSLHGSTVSHVNVDLLQDQEAYFVFTDRCLAWVNYEGRTRAGQMSSNPLQKPQQRKPPLRYLP